jgi:hypothetical protein
LLNTYPDTFAGNQIHIGDSYATTWGSARQSFYAVSGTPTAWFDGVVSQVGGTSGMSYVPQYTARHNIPSEYTIQASGAHVSGQTYRVSATICSQASTSRSMRVGMVHVLDYYPTSPSYSRNCFRQASATQDITLAPGACLPVTPWDITFDATSWAHQSDITILIWVQQISGGKEVYQAAIMNWPLITDCNFNDIPDECDVSCSAPGCSAYPGCGGSLDCNDNGIPDECEADCNGNGIPDDCDIASGFSQDCNQNGRPDECEEGGTSDCNGNGVPDLCDIYAGTSPDCNENHVPDECDIAAGTSEDCQGNGIPDECELLPPAIVAAHDNCSDAEIVCPGSYYTGTTVGATVDGSATCGSSSSTPDVWFYYQPYGNGFASFSLLGSSYDTVISLHTGCPGTTANQVACNDDYSGTPQSRIASYFVHNGVNYWIRISGKNGAVGEFQFSMTGPACNYTKTDCNQNDILDDCELLACPPSDPGCQDCNHNGVLDECDIASGFSQDLDLDGRPDECGPPCLTGDSNCDGAVNTFDIDPFVIALTDRTAWEAAYSCDYMCVNDCNGDGAVNAFDIDPFVIILTGGK